jgi:glycosyltransferase involved in cell wall biosynthesis
MKAKIVHVTSVHERSDVRIFGKQCTSLAAAGYNVHLLTADGKGDQHTRGVEIRDVGKLGSRLGRILKVPKQLLAQALQMDAELYHLHDPELLPIGMRLKRAGKRVIFDAHEDFPKQLLNKPYLNKPTAVVLSAVARRYEALVCRQLDAVVAATPIIRDKFLDSGCRSVDVRNFPLLSGIELASTQHPGTSTEICYVGGLTEIRGIRELVSALDAIRSPVRLNICGRFTEPSLEAQVRALPGWSKVEYHGYLDRAGVQKVLCRSFAGVVTLHPTPSYVEALPVKLFEYMAAGLPVIASDFPLWRSIVNQADCGICVDPRSPDAIADAIDYLFANRGEAARMGENGHKAILEKYNWSVEEAKLLDLYKEVLSPAHRRH